MPSYDPKAQMIRLTITPTAFDAISADPAHGLCRFRARAKTLRARSRSGLRRSWSTRLAELRGPGESDSDMILRLVAIEEEGRGNV
jgi:hypothetical protein